MPKLPTADETAIFIRKCAEERRAWAASPEGIKALGPGMATIPGLQEYDQVLAFVEGRPWPDR
jgi:hypothetical protein